jgi:hypothetical protein
MVEGATFDVQKTGSSLDVKTTSWRDEIRFQSLAFGMTSFDTKTHGVRRGAPGCLNAGKKSICVVLAIWAAWGVQVSQDENSFFADDHNL